jgi:hypothetical protein
MADAFYAPPLALVNGMATSEWFIGQQASAILAWKATAHLTVAFNYAHFIPGGSVEQAGGHSATSSWRWGNSSSDRDASSFVDRRLRSRIGCGTRRPMIGIGPRLSRYAKPPAT